MLMLIKYTSIGGEKQIRACLSHYNQPLEPPINDEARIMPILQMQAQACGCINAHPWCEHGRWKGGNALLDFEIWHVPIKLLVRNVLNFEWLWWNFATLCPPCKNLWLPLENRLLAPRGKILSMLQSALNLIVFKDVKKLVRKTSFHI